ncbi:MAG TPA: hypothetical protein VHR27_18315 [Blastocatellia bacterium]|nr:hypothetical protein [Blastocatellia bacterium]
MFAVCVLFCVSATSRADDLTIRAAFDVKASVLPNERIDLLLSRALQPADGSLAVLVGDTDVTAMLTAEAANVSYTPRLPLPAGESDVTVWLVSPGNQWKEIARFPLRVSAGATINGSNGATAIDSAIVPDSSNGDQAAPANNAAPTRRWGFDKVEPIKNISLNLKSQPGSSAFPAPQPGVVRETFTDLAGQTALGAMFTRGAMVWSNRFEIVGSSFQNEALRFGELGQKAPNVDLSNYLVQVQHGASNFALGHVSFGAHRHLINNISSRGVTAKLPLGKRADFTASAVNGTSVVGWSNFSGLNRRKHQILSGALGFEFLPARPQGFRIEAAALSGSLLPLNNFSQRSLTDAERSAGGSLRLVASDAQNRFKLDAGFARSRFTNPSDPLLEQGLNLTPARETTRSARFADASLALLRDLKLNSLQKANLTFNFRHERVDPLFRSVGAVTQADHFQNQFELAGALGEANFTLSHTRFNDNLSDLPSILKSLTRREALNINMPLSALIVPFIAGGEQSNGQTNGRADGQSFQWLPRLGFTVDRVHQFGAFIPINGGFRPDLVPDQISLNYNVSADWQFTKWRLGYRFNRSSQDNRQPGRELADLENLIHGLTLGLNLTPALDVNFDVNNEQANNFEFQRADRTLRYAVNTNWRMTPRATFALNLSTIGAGDLARTSSSRTIEGDAQLSYRMDAEHPVGRRLFANRMQAQFFIRYANRFARARDLLFIVNSLNKVWTLNTGMNLTF